MSQVLSDDKAPEGPRQNPILAVKNLSVTFRKRGRLSSKHDSVVYAVSDCSFDVFESETLSIVGESGSGKTTIVRCIVLLQNATSGSILYRGSDISKRRGDELMNYRRDVQVIYQDPFESLNPRQDVLETLSIPLRFLLGEKNREAIQEKAVELLKEVGLNPRVIDKYPHQLSGGERQRINIARALAANPKIIVADEPITMLDAEQRLNILRLLHELRVKRNLTVIMISHDLASSRILSDRVLVMYRGKLVELGASEDVLLRPHHPYVEQMLESMPRLTLKGTPEVDSEAEDAKDVFLPRPNQGCVFRDRCKYATEVCERVEPSLVELSKTHYAACHNPLNSS
jgi:oligopeptide/dipeptide ABC transporter ATP-binding protein